MGRRAEERHFHRPHRKRIVFHVHDSHVHHYWFFGRLRGLWSLASFRCYPDMLGCPIQLYGPDLFVPRCFIDSVNLFAHFRPWFLSS